jgi:hypothetical protein
MDFCFVHIWKPDTAAFLDSIREYEETAFNYAFLMDLLGIQE